MDVEGVSSRVCACFCLCLCLCGGPCRGRRPFHRCVFVCLLARVQDEEVEDDGVEGVCSADLTGRTVQELKEKLSLCKSRRYELRQVDLKGV